MPSINEFLKPEPLMPSELQKFDGKKPCSKCEKDSYVYYWNAVSLEMTWTCPDGHKNSYRIN
jgi:hypothetical protein